MLGNDRTYELELSLGEVQSDPTGRAVRNNWRPPEPEAGYPLCSNLSNTTPTATRRVRRLLRTNQKFKEKRSSKKEDGSKKKMDQKKDGSKKEVGQRGYSSPPKELAPEQANSRTKLP